jgi:hypothetical protein
MRYFFRNSFLTHTHTQMRSTLTRPMCQTVCNKEWRPQAAVYRLHTAARQLLTFGSNEQAVGTARGQRTGCRAGCQQVRASWVWTVAGPHSNRCNSTSEYYEVRPGVSHCRPLAFTKIAVKCVLYVHGWQRSRQCEVY